jgi:alkylation response protein AidB-like acyl-CoA dehydrogenase
MSRFDAAVDDFQWLLSHVIDLDEVIAMSGVENLDHAGFDALLGEAAKFIARAIAPIGEDSDRIGAKLREGRVITPQSWKVAYRAWRESGWCALSAPPRYGGQGMPFLLQACVATMLGGADLGFSMVAVAARGAASLLMAHTEPKTAAICVPRLVSGEWTATIAITEAHAGSDVGLLATKASRLAEGRFALTGEKMFISGGDHDLTDQILHIVLARIEGAAPGVKGLSLFLVPSRHFSSNGDLQSRNGIVVSRVEEKMGIHGSPTCAVGFDGAEAQLIGAEGAGLANLFTMMNELRIEVALNAVGIGACATAHAMSYANERRQGRMANCPAPVAIAHHPDVRRMLLIMQVQTEGGRALALETARLIDLLRLSHDAERRAQSQLQLDWLLPICKATLSEQAVHVADLGIQVRGGHGFIRDSGAEQFLRDSRVLPIYEGTNGIHAIDLVTRKLLRGDGHPYRAFVQAAGVTLARLADRSDLLVVHRMVRTGIALLETVSTKLRAESDEAAVLFAAKAYLDLAGLVAVAWMWLRIAAAAAGKSDARSSGKHASARFFASYYEPEMHVHAARVLTALDNESKYLLTSHSA